MARRTITMAALAATIVTAMIPAAAMAQDRYGDGYAGYGGYDYRQDGWARPGDDRRDDRRDWRDERGYDRRQDAYAGRDYRPAPIRYAYRDDRGYYDRGYDQDGFYDRNGYGQGGYQRAYRGSASHGYRCQCSGTTGAIVGALAGGLLGNGVAGRGDRTLGALLGGGAGALAGRAIERSNAGC